MSYNREVLELTKDKWATNLEGLRYIGCLALKDHVSILERKYGYEFDKEWITFQCDGKKKRCKQYRLTKTSRKRYLKEKAMVEKYKEEMK